ncbi:hypothetical protein JB92DRAFT_2883779, partial [Gautieria morchelliformis]
VKYFWNTHPGAANLVIILILPWAVLSLKPASPCTLWFQYTGYSATAEHLVVGAILIIRVYAMFNRNKRLLVALLVLYALTMTTEMIIIGVVTHEFHDNYLVATRGCVPIDIPARCWAYWVPSVTFDSTLLLLALWRAVSTWIIHDPALQPPRLVFVLLKDSFLYFGGVMMMTLANFITWYIRPVPFYGMFIGCFICSQSILGCRLLLNIRNTAAEIRECERHDVESIAPCSGILTTEVSVDGRLEVDVRP